MKTGLILEGGALRGLFTAGVLDVFMEAALRHIDEQVAAGCAFLICPDTALPISRVCHDPGTMQKVYDIGRATAECLLPQVRSFLGLVANTPDSPHRTKTTFGKK